MRVKTISRLLIPILAVIFLALPAVSSAEHSAFKIPSGMERRVDFWIDIFTRYSEREIVFHHRDYPYAVYDVIDFAPLRRKHEDNLDYYRKLVKQQKEARYKEIKSIIQQLAAGRDPGGALARKVKDAFELVPGGQSKYKQALESGQIRSQSGISERYREAIVKSGRYMPIIEKIFVEEFGLPIELTRLPFVESSFDYKAYSSVGAAGIWQFMPGTAKSYMKVGSLVDERRDVISATRGAAKYLRSAHETLGTWPLAVTSYNHGVAGVRSKVKKYGTKDIVSIVENQSVRHLGFASNNFFPELLAAVKVYKDYRRYFPGVKRESALQLAEYKLKHGASISHIKKRLHIDTETLKKYNYALGSRIWNGSSRIPRGYVLKVPASYRSNLQALNAPEPTSGSSSVVYGVGTYKVRKGDSLGRIAAKYRLTIKQLKQLNGLNSDRIGIGQVLNVGKGGATNLVSTGPSTNYTVRSGDNLGKIASRYRVSITALKSANHMKGSTIFAGQKLKIPGGARSSAAVAHPAYYKVKKGDSLWSISKRHGLSITQLKNLNNISGTTVKFGQKLRVK